MPNNKSGSIRQRSVLICCCPRRLSNLLREQLRQRNARRAGRGTGVQNRRPIAPLQSLPRCRAPCSTSDWHLATKQVGRDYARTESAESAESAAQQCFFRFRQARPIGHLTSEVRTQLPRTILTQLQTKHLRQPVRKRAYRNRVVSIS